MNRWTRRDFLRRSSALALAPLPAAQPAKPDERTQPARSRVVLIRRADAVDGEGRLNAGVLGAMLNEGIAALVGRQEPAEAWRQLFAARDVVGIKSNAWHFLPTPPELEQAVRAQLLRAGVAPENVAIDDHGVRGNPVFARATALVNVRPMRAHHWSSLGTCLKNMIMFVPRPPDYHGDMCASLGAIWQLPAVAGKVRLNVLVMLTPQFHAVGPHGFSKEFVWTYGGLILGRDPVAVDATGARIIAAKRRRYFKDEPPATPLPRHIVVADQHYHLGHSDAAAIDLVRLGWQDDALI